MPMRYGLETLVCFPSHTYGLPTDERTLAQAPPLRSAFDPQQTFARPCYTAKTSERLACLTMAGRYVFVLLN